MSKPMAGHKKKKGPEIIRALLGIWWSRRELNPRPKVFYDQFYVCSDVFEISLPLRRRTGSTSNQPPFSLMPDQVARPDTIRYE